MQKRQQGYIQLSNSTSLSEPSAQKPLVINPQTEPQVGGRARVKAKQPNRTTKTTQKLKLFPEEQIANNVEEVNDGKYNQISQLTQVTARREAERLSKQERLKLPRVTAYCTAATYRLDDLMKYLQNRKVRNSTAPKRLDEWQDAVIPPQELDQQIPEIIFFDYGVVVIWGMKEVEEKSLLRELVAFEDEKLAPEDVETEEFHFHYAASYQPRIYNDVITLKHSGNYMVKVTISHAIAQSVKMTLFEGLIEDTIEATKHIPITMAESGKVSMSRTAITKKIGQLFIMRININLVSNILDTPEIFWSEPAYEPLYSAIRGYLEISQRVELLNQRVAVISDLLDMLKEHLTSSHGEQLEWIVIVLIAFEIIIGVITICIDSAKLV
ncbi:1527_t:CDS:10 [Cetraspora pellucida]|uniref:1527_t:CDS:1 n=1 Tax=Cetraspora pellucida TaxID=1433469 RepID=A0A9N9IP64_9GLOM|nr:1527_t:CDS:10 [Cetraspora pellucida]